MDWLSVALLGVGLAMDAFSVSISKGLSCKRSTAKNALITGAVFGAFQALMPLIGWFIGSRFASFIDRYSGYIGFSVLCFIGIKMIIESFGADKENAGGNDIKSLLLLGIATSIDALAVGVTFTVPSKSGLNGALAVICACGIIMAITFILCFIGFLFGKKLEKIIGGKAEVFGGLVLCAIGVKFLIDALTV